MECKLCQNSSRILFLLTVDDASDQEELVNLEARSSSGSVRVLKPVVIQRLASAKHDSDNHYRICYRDEEK